MVKIIVLNYVAGTVNILTITDELLEKYDYDIEAILSNEYEFYHSEMAWMKLNLDEFNHFEVYHETLYERKS